MMFHLEKVQLPRKKNTQKLQSVYFPGPANSSQPLHHAIPIYSTIVYPGSKEKKAWEVLQKLKLGFLSKGHRDNTTVVFSIRKYQYHRSRQDSMDKNYSLANNPSILYSLHQYNRKRSTQNLQSRMDYQQRPSTLQTLP